MRDSDLGFIDIKVFFFIRVAVFVSFICFILCGVERGFVTFFLGSSFSFSFRRCRCLVGIGFYWIFCGYRSLGFLGGWVYVVFFSLFYNSIWRVWLIYSFFFYFMFIFSEI